MSDIGRSHAVGLPALALRPFISHYAGFAASNLTPRIDIGLPSRHLHLIISLGAPIEVLQMPNSLQCRGRFTALVSGMHIHPAIVQRGRSLDLLHVFLEPLSARSLLGVSGGELESRVYDLSDLWGHRANDLLDQLKHALSWSARFALLDAAFTRVLNPVETPPRLLRAWRQLARGDVSIDALARSVEWSRQHFTASFHAEFGVTPGSARRIFRFERACGMIRGGRPRLADVSAACGYHDQAHMTHEWNALAGCSPKTWIANELPFLQDYELAGGDDRRTL